MKKKPMVVAVLLAIAVFVCGNVLTNLQNRVTFPQEIKLWYEQNTDTVHTEEWLTEHRFQHSGILDSETADAYTYQLSTTGGYTLITVFDANDNTTPLRFKAKSDYYHLQTRDEFIYQFTIGTKSEDYMWINIYADTKAHAKLAVEEVTAFLESTV